MLKGRHLRNLVQKVGRFGVAEVRKPPGVPPIGGLSGFLGDQVRGFGFLSAGEFDTITRFHNVFSFDRDFPFAPNPGGFAHGEAGNAERRQVEQFLLAFDSNHAPIVGQQATLSTFSPSEIDARIDLMVARAEAGECDLIAKVGGGASARGYLYIGHGRHGRGPAIARSRDSTQETTFTCQSEAADESGGPRRDWHPRSHELEIIRPAEYAVASGARRDPRARAGQESNAHVPPAFPSRPGTGCRADRGPIKPAPSSVPDRSVFHRGR